MGLPQWNRKVSFEIRPVSIDLHQAGKAKIGIAWRIFSDGKETSSGVDCVHFPGDALRLRYSIGLGIDTPLVLNAKSREELEADSERLDFLVRHMFDLRWLPEVTPRPDGSMDVRIEDLGLAPNARLHQSDYDGFIAKLDRLVARERAVEANGVVTTAPPMQGL